ncbi:MAG: hypothetical protein A2284_18055 [Deltaproteobacteria bacterium RIFOXYA12_FULL_61_11]|nr:MAG: hypothetical protein A2284_18055 [Deltaproteobacteria bacterium RIFOXYA12_FULL_61_11]
MLRVLFFCCCVGALALPGSVRASSHDQQCNDQEEEYFYLCKDRQNLLLFLNSKADEAHEVCQDPDRKEECKELWSVIARQQQRMAEVSELITSARDLYTTNCGEPNRVREITEGCMGVY